MIYKLYPNTENLNDTDKFIWLMTTEEPVMLHLLQELFSSLSNERVNFVRLNIYSALNTAGTYGWYTSGNDDRAEGHFVWTDTGYPRPLNYTNWHAGQPNNVGNVQDCLLMQYPNDNFEWGDVNCNDKHPFICETHI